MTFLKSFSLSLRTNVDLQLKLDCVHNLLPVCSENELSSVTDLHRRTKQSKTKVVRLSVCVRFVDQRSLSHQSFV